MIIKILSAEYYFHFNFLLLFHSIDGVDLGQGEVNTRTNHTTAATGKSTRESTKAF
jgi:hypothetical protein